MKCEHGKPRNEYCFDCMKTDNSERSPLQQLVKCPFCGEDEALKPITLPTTKGEPWKTIVCMSCGARGPMSQDGLEANSLWQNRAI